MNFLGVLEPSLATVPPRPAKGRTAMPLQPATLLAMGLCILVAVSPPRAGATGKFLLLFP